MDCCVPKANGARRVPCPECGQVGRAVASLTARAILQPGHAAPLEGAAPRFCRTPECGVLYYGDAGQRALKQEALVRVGLKETADPVPVCYCFGFFRSDLQEDVAETGGSTIPDRIAAEVKAGRCACEVKNPSGACCLGDVNKVVKEAQAAGSKAVAAEGSPPDAPETGNGC